MSVVVVVVVVVGRTHARTHTRTRTRTRTYTPTDHINFACREVGVLLEDLMGRDKFE